MAAMLQFKEIGTVNTYR